MTAARAIAETCTIDMAPRIAALDWGRICADLEEFGCARTGPVLTAPECAGLVAGYECDAAFRGRVMMARYGYGRGEYRYFAYPLPPIVASLRAELYPRLVPIANDWMRKLDGEAFYPSDLALFLERCHGAGQSRPTPLILKYGPGDYNRLHQDLYGALAFPLQTAFLLSRPGSDFEGGEFVLTEYSPRRQSRVEVVPLMQGEGVVFAVNQRPVRGARGWRRVAMRHGVSRLRAGSRFTLGIIFHDAV